MPTTAPVSLSRIKQIAIPVHSVEKAKAFYRDTLGLKHLFDAPPALSFFDCGGVQLMLAGPEAQGKDGDKQHAVLFYDVSDIKETHARIKSSGAKYHRAAPHRPHGWARIWIADISDGQGTSSLDERRPEA
jgi:methylmalonyl-CoA/ethylmalonyl-CoA epimerase